MDTYTSVSAGSSQLRFSFGQFRLEAGGELFHGEKPVILPPTELVALRLLLAHGGQIVTPMQLRKALWSETPASADSVSKCIDSLRARLGPEDCIQTVYKRGYRLTADVRAEPLAEAGPDTAPSAAVPRLAILPFAVEFGVPEYFCCAVAEEAGALLMEAHSPVASVLAWDSVYTLAQRGLGALEIGAMMNADLVLTGTLRSFPAHYRLRAEMISVEAGGPIWVEDLLVNKDRTRGMGAALAHCVTFRSGSELVSISAGADDAHEELSSQREAYDLYRRAHHEWRSLQRHRMQDGLQDLVRAVELDPSLMAARMDLINLCVVQCLYGYMPSNVAAQMVRHAAASKPPEDCSRQHASLAPRADETASDFPDSMLPALGWIDFHVDRNLPAALRAFSLSAYLPQNRWISRLRVLFALSRRRFGEAIELLHAAIRLDPYSPWLQARLGWALHLAGESTASVGQMESALAQFPEHTGTSLYGALILAYNGEAARGSRIAEDLTLRSPYFDLAAGVYAYALACAGRGDEAREILERLQWLTRERFVLNSFTAAVHVALGEADEALDQLETSNESRCPWFFQMLADPRLKPLHGSPRFQQMQAILAAMEATVARDAPRD